MGKLLNYGWTFKLWVYFWIVGDLLNFGWTFELWVTFWIMMIMMKVYKPIFYVKDLYNRIKKFWYPQWGGTCIIHKNSLLQIRIQNFNIFDSLSNTSTCYVKFHYPLVSFLADRAYRGAVLKKTFEMIHWVLLLKLI